MTNKLPEVGKRYRNKLTGREYFLATIDAIFTRFSDEFIAFEFFFRIPFQEALSRDLDGNNQFRVSVVYDKEKLERFFGDYEELPPETEEEPNSDLKQSFEDYKNGDVKVHDSVDELFNSLDAQTIPEKADYSIVKDTREKPPSIWRSVEELPKKSEILIIVKSEGKYILAYTEHHLIFEVGTGNGIYDFNEWCYLTDSINLMMEKK